MMGWCERMEVAILGYGTVGKGVEAILHQEAMKDKGLHIRYILRRHQSQCTQANMVSDIQIILNDPKVDLIVEVLGGIEPAHTWIIEAMKHKHHVVSANKAVIAKYLDEFSKCARENKVAFAYEASCGGGIPWLSAIHKAKRIDTIHELHGIFNGTANFILDHMQKDGCDYQDVLKQAQTLGYAERDPYEDVEGIDSTRKLYIASSLAYDASLPYPIPCFGISHITLQDIKLIQKWQLCCRLISQSRRVGKHCAMVTEPILYPYSASEAAVSENNNIGCFYGDTIGELKFFGQGAGKLPTANAIIQDILDIDEHVCHEGFLSKQNLIIDERLLHGKYLIRCKAQAKSEALLSSIYEQSFLFDHAHYMITKDIPCAQMHALYPKLKELDDHCFFARFHEDKEYTL